MYQNSMMVFLMLLAVLVGTLGHYQHHHHLMIPHYHFSYGVHDPHTKDHKSQQEHRHEDEVRGTYTVDDPDGTKRIVEYVAGKHSGFRAIVKREGKGYFPDSSGHGHGAITYWGDTFWGHGSGK